MSPYVTRASASTATAERVDEWMAEGINLNADIPCETTYIEGECPNPADYAVNSHLTPRFFLCHACWVAEEGHLGNCPETGVVEDRDDHYRIVEVLR